MALFGSTSELQETPFPTISGGKVCHIIALLILQQDKMVSPQPQTLHLQFLVGVRHQTL